MLLTFVEIFNSFTTTQGDFVFLPGSMTLTTISGVSRPSQRLGPNYLESA